MAIVPSFEEVHFSLIILLLLFELKNHEGAEEIIAQLPEDTTYIWKEGVWSDCVLPTGCGNGEKRRIVWCEDEKGYKSADTHCDLQKKPSEHESCFKPCRRHKHSVRWRTSKWGPCLNINSTSQCKEQMGIMIRDIVCVQRKRSIDTREKTLEEKACSMLQTKPPSRKPCLVACPQDCIVSDFGNWSKCDDCTKLNKIRTRRILVAPTRGGKQCPPLVESQPCSHTVGCLRNTSPVYEFSIKLERWSPCISSYNLTRGLSRNPVVGSRKRDVACVNGLGEIVHTSWCTTSSTFSAPTVESCIVSTDCQLTEWSQWSLLSEGCVTSNGRIYPEIRGRNRKISLLSEGDGAPCSHLMEKRTVSENLPSCSSRYKWVHSDWGDCMIYEGSCGGGLQRRNLICMRSKDVVPVEESLCKEPKPPEVQQCYISCQQECLVSSWSQWGECKSLPMQLSEGELLGYRQRERKILQSPSGEDDDCDSLVEVDSCHDSATVSWLTGNWSDCLLNNVMQPCGEGTRKRNVSCVKTTREEVPSLCDSQSKRPKLIASCYVPCPRDCVLSEWTEWTACTITCSSSNGLGVKKRSRKILAEPGPGGKPCPSSLHLTETEPCGYDSCFGYRWEKSKWSPCYTKSNRTCGKGVQERQVICIHNNEITVSDKKCLPVSKSKTERSCNVPCPVDCVVTNFTDWTPCPLTCIPGATQQRVRYILRYPSQNGKSCPANLEETKPCVLSEDIKCLKKINETRTKYRWEIAAWRKCTLTQDLQCGDGFQVRKVSCVGEDGKEVIPHYCLASTKEKLPASSRRCHVFCNQRCALSEWSSWSSDERSGCLATITRTREAAGAICAQESLLETKSITAPPILPSSDGHWSKCITNQNNKEFIMINGKIVRGMCGSGWRYIRGNQVDGCKQLGILKDMCIEDCPESCQLSEWSDWSFCNVTCGQGYRHRQRYVMKYGNQLGRPCLSVNDTILQEVACDQPCDQYQWITGEWSPCEILQAGPQACGIGIQKRTVSCNKLLERNALQVVDETFCDSIYRPDDEIECNIPCPDDCVVSVWSSWSKCTEPCNSLQSRKRNRKVLRLSLVSTGTSCPTLHEEEPCILGSNCCHHKWTLGGWSSCILPKGAVCGQGKSSRAVSCVRSNGRYVHPRHCQKSSALLVTKPCDVECPVDCEVSEWTIWNDEECKPCNHNGERKRTRHILQTPNSSGLPCPIDFVQSIPCPFQPCYHWSLTEWSNCSLQGASCGHGYRIRETVCKRDDGVEVDKGICLRINMTENIGGWLDSRWLELAYSVQETESCHKPCPGDCVLTDWSSWSLCHRDCLSGHVVGYKTRSRAVILQRKNSEKCPYPLWETKPCWGGPCLTYAWKLKDGLIRCLRSDGIVTNGGCDSLPRPCYPACHTKQSRCNHVTGECICSNGFLPLYNKTGTEQTEGTPRIIKCIEENLMHIEYLNNHTSAREEIVLRYYPDDNEFSFWMYAMICVGSAFVIFVVVTIYLMCSHNPTLRGNEEARTVRMKSYAAR